MWYIVWFCGWMKRNHALDFKYNFEFPLQIGCSGILLAHFAPNLLLSIHGHNLDIFALKRAAIDWSSRHWFVVDFLAKIDNCLHKYPKIQIQILKICFTPIIMFAACMYGCYFNLVYNAISNEYRYLFTIQTTFNFNINSLFNHTTLLFSNKW